MTVTDDDVVQAWRDLSTLEGIFCEPASAAGIAALTYAGVESGATVVCIVTGHGLKDPEAVERVAPEAVEVDPHVDSIAEAVA